MSFYEQNRKSNDPIVLKIKKVDGIWTFIWKNLKFIRIQVTKFLDSTFSKLYFVTFLIFNWKHFDTLSASWQKIHLLQE